MMKNIPTPPLWEGLPVVLLYWKLYSVGGELAETEFTRDWRLCLASGGGCADPPSAPPAVLAVGSSTAGMAPLLWGSCWVLPVLLRLLWVRKGESMALRCAQPQPVAVQCQAQEPPGWTAHPRSGCCPCEGGEQSLCVRRLRFRATSATQL